MEFVNHNIHW